MPKRNSGLGQPASTAKKTEIERLVAGFRAAPNSIQVRNVLFVLGRRMRRQGIHRAFTKYSTSKNTDKKVGGKLGWNCDL